MLRHPRRLALIGLFVLLPATVYWVAWRSRLLHAPGEPPDARVVAERKRVAAATKTAADLYATLGMVEVSEIGSVDQLDEAVGTLISADLGSLEASDSNAYGSDRLTKVRDDIVGMMYYRWLQPSFEAYDAFMRSKGYSLPESWAQLSGGHQAAIAGSYPIWTERELDTSRTPLELIREMWEAGPPGEGRAASLRAVSVDPDGVEAASRRVCPGGIMTAELGGRLGSAGWEGAKTATCVQFYQPGERRPFDLEKSGRCVEIVRVGVVLRFKDGVTCPFVFNCWFNPEDGQWYIYSISMQNYGEDFGGVFF